MGLSAWVAATFRSGGLKKPAGHRSGYTSEWVSGYIRTCFVVDMVLYFFRGKNDWVGSILWIVSGWLTLEICERFRSFRTCTVTELYEHIV